MDISWQKTIYCEFCGAPANTEVWDPERLVCWTHQRLQDVVRCAEHYGTSKRVASCRSHDPLTGEKYETGA